MWKLGPSLISVLMITINFQDVYSQKPKLGDGIRIPGRASSLRENIRVLPRNGNEGWYFRQPTDQLFEDPEALPKVIQPSRALNELDFHYEFCENSTQLLQAYFRRFKIEGTRRPWKFFAQDWTTSSIAALFGINESSITSGYHSYFFIKIEKSLDNQTLANDLVLNDVNSIKIGQQDKPIGWNTIPTHYIHSYATGNAVYQVLVFLRDHYEYFKDEMRDRGLEVFSNRIRDNFFSPSYVKDVGKIRTASGNHSVESWATESLQSPHRFGQFSSLMKFYRNATLLNQLDKLLGDEVLLQLEMRSLAHLL